MYSASESDEGKLITLQQRQILLKQMCQNISHVITILGVEAPVVIWENHKQAAQMISLSKRIKRIENSIKLYVLINFRQKQITPFGFSM